MQVSVTNCRDCPLRAFETFSKMSAEEVSFMERFKVGELQIAAGAPILLQGTTAAQFFTVLSGMGLREKTTIGGGRQVLNFIFPGDLIGLQASVMDDMNHGVVASTDMRLCVFDRSQIWTLFRNQPERAFGMTWLAAIEERFMGDTLATIGQRSALERIAWALAGVFRRLGALGLERDGSVPFPYRQQDMADALGLSLVHTNKTLGRLRADGLATWADGRLTLHDQARLEEIAMLDSDPEAKRPLM